MSLSAPSVQALGALNVADQGTIPDRKKGYVNKCEEDVRRLDVIAHKLGIEALGGQLQTFLQAPGARLQSDVVAR